MGFFVNHRSNDIASILLTSAETHQVEYSIEAPSVNYYYNGTIPAGGVIVLNVSKKLIVTSTNDQDKGIYLSINSEKVSVIGQSLYKHTSDSYLALPTLWLGDTYVYYGVAVPSRYFFSPIQSSFLMVGTENNTVLNLTVTQSVTVNVSNTVTNLIPRRQYSFVINRLQTVYVRSAYDLTGTKIVTDKPVSVFSGHECANIPWRVGACSYVIEQIPPVMLWGKVYYTAPLVGKSSYTIKVLAAYDSTSINIHCTNIRNSTASIFGTINERDFKELTLSQQAHCAIHSNKKILVVQFSHGGREDNAYGDPMMTLVPAADRHLSKFDFSTFHSSKFSHHVNIIVKAQYYQPDMIHLITGGVNRSLVTQQWVPVQVNNITETYATQVNISEGKTKMIKQLKC